MRKICFLLAAALICSVMPMGVLAEGGLTYTEADLLGGRMLISSTEGATLNLGSAKNLDNNKVKWTEMCKAGGVAMKFAFTLDTDNAKLLLQARETGFANQLIFSALTDKLLINSANNPSGNPWYETVNVSHTVGTKYTYIITADSTGYTLYRKAEGDAEYTQLGTYLYNTAVTSATNVRWLPEAGTVTMDYILIAGPQSYSTEEFAENTILGSAVRAHSIDFSVPGSTGSDLALLGAGYNTGADADRLQYTATADGIQATDYIENDAIYAGFEFQKREFKTRMENGGVKLTFKVDDAVPFEFTFGSGSEGFVIAADLMPDRRMRYWVGEASYLQELYPLETDTFYNYIFKRDASSGQIEVYSKKEEDTYYKQILVYSPPAYSNNVFRIRAVDTASIGTFTVKEVAQYLNPADTKPTLTDVPAIMADGSTLFFEDDFSTQKETWTTPPTSVADGVMVIGDKTGFAANGIGLDGSTPFAVKFRHKLTAATEYAVVNLSIGGKRVYYYVYPNKIALYPTNTVSSMIPQIGVWYEYLFDFDGAGTVDVYRRREGDANWTTLWTDYVLSDVDNDSIWFGPSGAELDDIKIYHGAGVKLDAPEVSGSTLNISGDIEYGSPDSTHNRRATVLAAAYNSQYGYTEKVWTANVTAVAGETTNINETFDLGGAGSNITAMAWDSVDTIHPLTKAVGYEVPNDAATVTADPISYETNHNEVLLNGFVGRYKEVTAALLRGTEVKAAVQLTANRDGMIDTLLAVDPAACTSGSYTLRIAYAGGAAADYPVTLACDDIGHNDIDNATEFVHYINAYAKEEIKTQISAAGFADAAYTRFAAIKNGAPFADFYAFRNAIEKAVRDETDERELLALINPASAEKKWSVIKTLVTETYRDYLGTDLSLMTGITSVKDMFLRMTEITYTSKQQIIDEYTDAATKQKAAEASLGGSGGSGGSGGGNGGSGGGGGNSLSLQLKNPLPEGLLNNTLGSTELKTPFPDLSSVPWAVDSINTLQRACIVSGDDNGNFNPNANITREEFLKLLMGAAGIAADVTASPAFGDVDKNEWYFGYVNAAKKLGIVNGVSTSKFGIGEKITRADMAVMIKRILDHRAVNAKANRPAFVFDDFENIPGYARESISYLCEAELLNGMGENKFMPMANATRAEAAVAICRIYELLR